MAKRNKRMTPATAMGRTLRVNTTVKGRVTNDTTLSGNTYSQPITSIADGSDAFYFPINPINTVGFISSSTVRSIVQRYTEYRALPNTTVHWEPRCPLTATGNYWVGWSENAEFHMAFVSASPSVRVAMVKTLSNAKCYPIWQASTMRIGASRRNWYAVDNNPYSVLGTVGDRAITAMDYDRGSQGAFYYAVEGALPETQVAIMYSTESYKVRGLLGAIPAA